MDEVLFQDLLTSVKDMGRHLRGEEVEGIRITEAPEPNVKAVRESAGLSQSQLAGLMGVSRRTLANWEQHRVRLAGPARALLKIIAANPQAALEVLDQGYR
jgi:putative transcriptional regulator